MSNIITLTATNGETIQFVNEIKAQGGMKDVMFSPNKDYVVAFFREPADVATRERLEQITGLYRKRIFEQEGGEYLKKLYCWPPPWWNTMVNWVWLRRFTAIVFSLNTAAATTTCSTSKAKTKTANGLPAHPTAIASLTRVNWATG
nr:hypothetical protein [Alysiella crassa]UOP06487.1 hypothetical protein LVJ80_12095 [Alysiella crassa]